MSIVEYQDIRIQIKCLRATWASSLDRRYYVQGKSAVCPFIAVESFSKVQTSPVLTVFILLDLNCRNNRRNLILFQFMPPI